MTMITWIGIGFGFFISLSLPYFLRPYLRRAGLVDIPNDRSSHQIPTIRGGGLGSLLGFAAGGIFVCFGLAGNENSLIFSIIFCTALLTGLIGALEDIWGLTIAVRASSQLILGIFLSLSLGVVLGVETWLMILAALFFTAYVNFANFMDGINGISGFHGAVTGGSYALIGIVLGLPWLVASGLLIAMCFGAFLPWNLKRPRIFLGDVGSYLLGGAIAATLIAALYEGAPLLTLISPISIYLADTVSVVLRRVSRREGVLRAHRTHTYQRLTDTGFSHIQVSVIVTLFSGVNALFGILSMLGAISFWVALICVLFVCILYLLLPRIRGNVLPPRPVFKLGKIDRPATINAREGFAPSRFIVLGSSGFVGSAVVQNLRKDGFEVVKISAPRVELSPAIYDPHEVAKLGKAHPAVAELATCFIGTDVIINAAGLATPDHGPSEELYGANSMLPPIVAWAAERADVKRVIHLSSAAVQGRNSTLDETLEANPFSPYSHSKALGERAFLIACSKPDVNLIVIRATSVQGPGRATTESLRLVAQSPLASVANPGRQPTVVSSIDGLADFVRRVACSQRALAPVMLQPWEGLSVSEVLSLAGNKRPLVIPKTLCLILLTFVRIVGLIVPEINGAARRLELMWLGQRQDSLFVEDFPAVPRQHLEQILRGSSRTHRVRGKH